MRSSKILLPGLMLAASVPILSHYARRVEVLDDDRTGWLKSTLIVHRGLHDNSRGIPENSMLAFAQAVEKGYMIEMDVAWTKDKQLVVFHDEKLTRLMGTDRYLRDMTFPELSQLPILSTNQTVPLFSEVLSLIAGRVPLLIEIKNEGPVGEMEQMILALLQDYSGRYAVESFNPFTVKWFRKNAPNIVRGQLASNFVIKEDDQDDTSAKVPGCERFFRSRLLMNFAGRPNFITYQIQGTSIATLKSLRKLGVPLLGYTIDDRAQYARVKDYFDNVIVNTVDIY